MRSTRMSMMNGLNLRLLAGGLVVAAAIWGVYGWRFARRDLAGSDADRAAAQSGLRGAASDEVDDPSASPRVMANVPISTRGGQSWLEQSGDAVETPRASPGLATPRDPQTLGGAPSASPPANRATVESLFQTGRAAMQSGETIAARAVLSQALASDAGHPAAAEVRRELQRLANVSLFSRATNLDDPLVDVHQLKSGEALLGVADRYQLNPALIATINRLPNPDVVPVGTRLKLLRGPFRAEIDKSDHRLDVWLGGVFVKSYAVGLGRDGGTPAGRWKVVSKVSNPAWVDPTTSIRYAADDPANPIGERWIGLQCQEGECLGATGFGIHGTLDAGSIGRNESMGCVRLAAEDVAELYDLLLLERSTVEIHP